MEEDNTTPLPRYTEAMTPEKALSSFFLLVFTANPSKDNIRVIVDGGDVKFSLKRDRFLSLIESYMGKSMSNACEPCTKEYGTSYLINRSEGTLKKLYNSAVKEKLNPVVGFKCLKKVDDSLSKEYQDSLQKALDSDMKKQQNPIFSVNKSSGYVDLTNIPQK